MRPGVCETDEWMDDAYTYYVVHWAFINENLNSISNTCDENGFDLRGQVGAGVSHTHKMSIVNSNKHPAMTTIFSNTQNVWKKRAAKKNNESASAQRNSRTCKTECTTMIIHLWHIVRTHYNFLILSVCLFVFRSFRHIFFVGKKLFHVKMIVCLFDINSIVAPQNYSSCISNIFFSRSTHLLLQLQKALFTCVPFNQTKPNQNKNFINNSALLVHFVVMTFTFIKI